MNEEGQWIVLMGLLVAVGMLFLALVINQSALVGQTTAEAVLEFPKSDIKDLRSAVFDLMEVPADNRENVKQDIYALSLHRKNSVVKVDIDGDILKIHFNNGVTMYYESYEFV
ncbi:MAG: hypothetical protein KO206_03290 [Methanomicrobiaceae archaeon]|nr:hypothetical protein [Methanomicrobiaceae archaeon]